MLHVYICIYTYMHTCVRWTTFQVHRKMKVAYIHTHVHPSIHTDMQIHTLTLPYTRTLIYIHTYITEIIVKIHRGQGHIHTHIHIYTHMHACLYQRDHRQNTQGSRPHTYTHTHIYTCMHACIYQRDHRQSTQGSRPHTHTHIHTYIHTCMHAYIRETIVKVHRKESAKQHQEDRWMAAQIWPLHVLWKPYKVIMCHIYFACCVPVCLCVCVCIYRYVCMCKYVSLGFPVYLHVFHTYRPYVAGFLFIWMLSIFGRRNTYTNTYIHTQTHTYRSYFAGSLFIWMLSIWKEEFARSILTCFESIWRWTLASICACLCVCVCVHYIHILESYGAI